jgi:Magnesium chelatase, subunit ChlI
MRKTPRAGKSMLARRLTTILPAMTLPEALETTRIHCVAGRTGVRTAVVTTRPCRPPSHDRPYGADRRQPGVHTGEDVAGASRTHHPSA